MRQEALGQAIERLAEISARLAYSAPPVAREDAPNIEQLRAAVKERLATMPPRRKRKKAMAAE